VPASPHSPSTRRILPAWLWIPAGLGVVVIASVIAFLTIGATSISTYERREALRYDFQTARAQLARAVIELVATEDQPDPYVHRASMDRVRASIERMRIDLDALAADGNAADVKDALDGLNGIGAALATGAGSVPLREQLDRAHASAERAFEA
jgi:hypothetical protein